MSRTLAICLLASSFLVAPVALAGVPDDAPAMHLVAKKDKGERGNSGNHGNDNSNKPDEHPGNGDSTEHAEQHRDWRFKDGDRQAVIDFYRSEYGAGRCPPGLAKKNNGCLPPGQAKKAWNRGQYLPADYTYYNLPSSLYDRLDPPPYGYRYVTVDGDIILIELASRLIVDLIQPGY